MPDSPPQTRCGVVAVVGEPNAGKSSLMNALVGQPLSIVSRRPQATREPVIGIVTREQVQLVFVDQPGLFEPRYLLHEAMREAAIESLSGADAVLYTVPCDSAVVPFEDLVGVGLVPEVPRVLVRTKSDLASTAPGGEGILVSAQDGSGLQEVLDWCATQVPVGPFRYDIEDVSTQPVRFFAAEYVREAAFDLLDDELPYAVAVEITDFREGSDPLYIGGTILVERESQKPMVIGQGGRMIRQLGTQARGRIEELLGQKVYLDLWVKVLPKWRTRQSALARFGLPFTEKKKI